MTESEEFFRQYAERSNITVAKLRELGKEVFPCHPDCDYAGCEGWQIRNKKAYEEHLKYIEGELK